MLLKKLIMMELRFQCNKHFFNKIEVKNDMHINMFGYENGLMFPIYVSDQTF